MSKIIKVTNRNNGSTGYTIPNLGVHRVFQPRETMNIDLEELKALSYTPGGDYILKNYLVMDDENALSTLNMEVEPEYFYTEDEVKELLLNGSIDQLEDALNFAPSGVIDLIKNMSVELQIPDTRKRDLISEKTGFSVDSAINLNKIMVEETEKVEEVKPKRKTAAPTRKAKTIVKK